MLTIELPVDVERRFEALVRTTGQSSRFHAERAIVEYFDDLDDHQAAEREIGEVRAGRSVPVPLSELLKSYDLADRDLCRRSKAARRSRPPGAARILRFLDARVASLDDPRSLGEIGDHRVTAAVP